jgi:hypothetical protein
MPPSTRSRVRLQCVRLQCVRLQCVRIRSVFLRNTIINFPKKIPKIGLAKVQRRIPWKNRSGKAPCFGLFTKACTNRIFQDIPCNGGKGIALAFLLAKHVIIGLLLQAKPLGEQTVPSGAQQTPTSPGIGFRMRPEHQKVRMIRHDAIDGNHTMAAHTGMKQNLAQRKVQYRGEPSGCALIHAHCPVNTRSSPIRLRL